MIAYLIKFHKMGFLSALKFVRKRRKEICPNINFEYQLKKYDLIVHSKLKDFAQLKYQLPKIVTISHHNHSQRYKNSVLRVSPPARLATSFDKEMQPTNLSEEMQLVEPGTHVTLSNPVLNNLEQVYVKRLA